MQKFDLKHQAFRGQNEITDDNAVNRNTKLTAENKTPFPTKTDKDITASLNNRAYLNEAGDEEIIETYYRLRDARQPWDDGWVYPNIALVAGTAFEREKDRREISQWNEHFGQSELVRWYAEAKTKPCTWWMENHIIARHSLTSCMSCGNCTSLCPAAEFFDYNPRIIMETVQQNDEEALVELLSSETLWYCFQCGSCKPKCPRKNNPFGIVSSLRQLSQLKGLHVHSVRGRQQYAGRHLWGGNLWNRACSLYFRNAIPATHKDFGPRYEEVFQNIEENFSKVGASPDMEGTLSGRKVRPETLHEVRRIWHFTGAVHLWDAIEQAGAQQAATFDLSIDAYHDKVKTEG
ncbi:MAG: 4Fe-4S dicluster domain-containing protein [Desulfobacteraceae bacterium]|jgi:heterodisulfide reductase subunit C